MNSEGQQIAEAALEALQNWDLNRYESFFHGDAVEGRPQLRERFIGLNNIMGMYRSFPIDPPNIEWERVRGGGTLWVGEGTIDYRTGDPRIG